MYDLPKRGWRGEITEDSSYFASSFTSIRRFGSELHGTWRDSESPRLPWELRRDLQNFSIHRLSSGTILMWDGLEPDAAGMFCTIKGQGLSVFGSRCFGVLDSVSVHYDQAVVFLLCCFLHDRARPCSRLRGWLNTGCFLTEDLSMLV